MIRRTYYALPVYAGLIILISLMFSMGFVSAWWQGNTPMEYFKFNQGSGDGIENINGIYNLTNIGITYIPGKLGNASSNFTNDAKQFQNNSLGNLGISNFTIAIWFNESGATSGLRYLLASNNGYNTGWGLWQHAAIDAGVLCFNYGGLNNTCSLTSLNDSLWHRAIITRDITTNLNSIKLYIDGNLVNQTNLALNTNFSTSNTGLRVGGVGMVDVNYACGRLTNCSIDDLQFYNTTWSLLDVKKDWNNGLGLEADSGIYGIWENNQTYNTTTYETNNENFNINLTYDNSYYSSISANLTYNGTQYIGTKIGTGSNIIFFKSLSMESPYGNKSFYWNVSLTNSTGTTYYTSTINTQTVNPVIFGLCNSTNNISYINFTFKNEFNESYMNASLDLATWNYSLSGSSSKLFTFTNNTPNSQYSFCFSPPDKSIIETLTFQYSLTGHPQRQYYLSGTLSNSTTYKTLYLLSSNEGIYSTYITSSSSNVPVSGVILQVERQFSGVWTLISQGTSDSAGSTTFWLNPNYDHKITATKSGYTSTTVTLRPTQSIYTIVMGGTTSNATYSNILEGMTYTISPKSGFLNTNTTYHFEFNLSASLGNLVNYKMELELKNGTVLSSTIGTNPYGSNLSVDFNTGDYGTLYGKYYIDIGSGYYLIDPSIWALRNITAEDGSIYDAIRNLINYRTDIEDNYGQLWWIFFLTFVLLASLCYFTGAELTNPGIVLIPLFLFVIVFSYMGFFTIDFSPNSFMNKYGIAMVSFFLTSGFILSRFQ